LSIFHTAKPKSASKQIISNRKDLAKVVVETLNNIAEIVGATLGPGGRQVLIENPQINYDPIITKDGVTVIKHLGYHDPVKQLILESSRAGALRTAIEAGDGTTSCTILSAAICKLTHDVVQSNPKLSPQLLVRSMQKLVPVIKQLVKDKYTIQVDLEDYETFLFQVAKLSANADEDLATKIVESFDLVGEEGNLTIVETTGPTEIKIERINGYTIDRGYEETLKKFSSGFINDKTGTIIGLENPVVVLYDGVINDVMLVWDALSKLAEHFETAKTPHKNVLLIAHGFSDVFLADMHANWNHPNTPKILPLMTPESPIPGWKTQFLLDLQAYTGAPVFNVMDKPLSGMDINAIVRDNLVTAVEMNRYRTSIISKEDPLLLEYRVDQLKELLKSPESQYEQNDLNVRIGKLTSGIARMYICGPSVGETRERRDRADDAWMAIRGAIKDGACPGGGYVLVKLADDLTNIALESTNFADCHAASVLAAAFMRPVRKLFDNFGHTTEEENEIIAKIKSGNQPYDIYKEAFVSPLLLLDSSSAVTQAIENSISISSLLGTLGGIVSFNRDHEADEQERSFARGFNNAIGDDK